MAYTPLNVQYPWCGDTQDEVIEDLKILSQLTPRIRIYGMDCRQFEYIMNGINALNIRMGVIPTIWVDNNITTYNRQYETFFKVADRYGWDNIIGVSVGNEALYRKEISVEELQKRVKDVRDRIKAAGHPEIPVFSTDIEQLDKIIEMSDILFDNVHPFFAGTTVEDAATWTFQYFQEHDVDVAAKVGKKAVISEVGWPTGGASDRGAVASVANLQKLLDTFVCEANKRKVPNFFFEIFDEPWKIIFNEPRETMWGVFTDKKQLKSGITLPNCPLPAYGQGSVGLFE
ncbi:glycoside hydrolase [Basidiobolus meristosporus CBS 931.73]|uniref:glucan endo-1,3-beta-D-glucosidase n=1 Tax=Basidiobolus meristosporus CBS 931.73 TaxID=1314790 RepID=A0A1Y1Y2J5_9FUNG|nr:glycoside hydrolase [Basidiobolus meristosporus CBS 931.73]|eukprot:ORX92223.1 glycoside hydrolase [Basidiobolus meristosporus CBS 931.73]